MTMHNIVIRLYYSTLWKSPITLTFINEDNFRFFLLDMRNNSTTGNNSQILAFMHLYFRVCVYWFVHIFVQAVASCQGQALDWSALIPPFYSLLCLFDGKHITINLNYDCYSSVIDIEKLLNIVYGWPARLQRNCYLYRHVQMLRTICDILPVTYVAGCNSSPPLACYSTYSLGLYERSGYSSLTCYNKNWFRTNTEQSSVTYELMSAWQS